MLTLTQAQAAALATAPRPPAEAGPWLLEELGGPRRFGIAAFCGDLELYLSPEGDRLEPEVLARDVPESEARRLEDEAFLAGEARLSLESCAPDRYDVVRYRVAGATQAVAGAPAPE